MKSRRGTRAPIRREAGRRGSAVLLALFFLMATTSVAYAFLLLVPGEIQSAWRLKMDTGASLACDAGVQDTLAWMRACIDNGKNPVQEGAGQPPAYLVRRAGSIGDFAWAVTIQPDPCTPPRGVGGSPAYLLVSEARLEARSRPCRRVRAWVTTGESFTKWVRFMDEFDDRYWWRSDQVFDGPVHVNGPHINMLALPGFYSSTGPAVFRSTVTTGEAFSSPDGVHYYSDTDSAPYDASGNPIPGRYERLFKDGRSSLRAGVGRIELPPDASGLSEAAWGSSRPVPGTDGVYVNSDGGQVSGGIYIRGDVSRMLLSVDPAGNAVTRVSQGSGTTVVTRVTEMPITSPGGKVVGTGNTLVVAPDGSETVLSGFPNGAVYATGDIGHLSGVNRGAQTIAVDSAAGKEIVLGGNVTRADTPVGEKPSSTRDRLGLVAEFVRIPTSIPPSTTNPLQVYASILVGRREPGSVGGIKVDGWNGPRGRVCFYGSIIMKKSYIASTTQGTGLLTSNFYDPSQLAYPPPFFPVAGGKVTIRGWQEEALTP